MRLSFGGVCGQGFSVWVSHRGGGYLWTVHESLHSPNNVADGKRKSDGGSDGLKKLEKA